MHYSNGQMLARDFYWLIVEILGRSAGLSFGEWKEFLDDGPDFAALEVD